jgi:DNA-directed RNA polymerase beta' subunit
MEHKNIILTRFYKIYDSETKKHIEIEKESGSFTFNGILNSTKIEEPKKSRIIFTNANYISYKGISLNKIYLLEKLQYSAGGMFRVHYGIVNDFGEKKFYPSGAFSFFDDDF